jgi:hypothetical protein
MRSFTLCLRKILTGQVGAPRKILSNLHSDTKLLGYILDIWVLQVCQGTARQRALREVPQDAGQLEALGAWSGVTARKGRQVRSLDWGPKTGNTNKENGEEGRGQWQVQCSR